MGSVPTKQTDSSSFSVDPSGNITRHQQKETSSVETNQSDTVVESPPGNIEMKVDLQKQEQEQEPATLIFEPQPIQKPSVFQEIEQNLVRCYKDNKNLSTLNCERISKQYKDLVELQRNQMLKKAVNVPLITTILFIISCILLHITTINCYGAISIDLGSEWMKVGLVAPSVQMDIVLNAASQRKTAMAIAFSNNERFIGDTALDVASKYPERTYTHFLDLVGKTIEHESVKHYKRRFPYVDITSHEPNSTSILLNHPDGLKITPLELIAMMLEHAHDQVTARLDSNEPASDVVITVPPFFEAKERKVIEDAARLVGLNVLRLTNTNSAFALSYGIFRHKDYLEDSNKTSIVFFDQGASSTSVTVADFHLETTSSNKNESLPTITIRAQAYDRYLGGFDMQLQLRDYFVREFTKMTKVDEKRIYKRGRSIFKLLKEAGRVKKVLSANTDFTVRVENVIDDMDFKLPISRQDFEELNKDYLSDRVVELLDKLFAMPNVSRDERFESVIIVGGNTRTPKIQQILQDYFKLDNLGKSINADEGAALAALYQAASLGRGFRVKKFKLEEFDMDLQPQDPIYSEAELEAMRERLVHMREQDFLRSQVLSLRNSLESLIVEGRELLDDEEEASKDKREELEELIVKTSDWLKRGPQEERNNVTILADKYNAIQLLVHPPPPPPPPFDPSTVDLSSMLNNDTLNIFNAFKNFTNPFASSPSEVNETAFVEETTSTTTAPSQTSEGGAATTEALPSTPEPSKVVSEGPPPHTEL